MYAEQVEPSEVSVLSKGLRNVSITPTSARCITTFCGGAKLPLQPGGGSFCPWLLEEDILFESIQLLGLWCAREAVERFVDE